MTGAMPGKRGILALLRRWLKLRRPAGDGSLAPTMSASEWRSSKQISSAQWGNRQAGSGPVTESLNLAAVSHLTPSTWTPSSARREVFESFAETGPAFVQTAPQPRPAGLRKTQLLPENSSAWQERQTEEAQAALFDLTEEDLSWLNSSDEGEATVRISALDKLRLMAGPSNKHRVPSQEYQP